MTIDDIRNLAAEMQRLASKATPGPLRVNRYDNDGGEINWQVQQEGGDAEVIANISDDEPKRARHDAVLFARSRTAIPALCDTVEALLAVVDALPKCCMCKRVAMWYAWDHLIYCEEHHRVGLTGKGKFRGIEELRYAAALRALLAGGAR